MGKYRKQTTKTKKRNRKLDNWELDWEGGLKKSMGMHPWPESFSHAFSSNIIKISH
jgi:hypothetical protein